MSGGAYRFEFTADSSDILEVVNNTAVTSIDVSIVHESSGYVLAVYRRQVSDPTERLVGIYSLLRDINIEFVCCPASDRHLFKVRLVGRV